MARKPKTFDAHKAVNEYRWVLETLKAQDNALASDLLFEFGLENNMDTLTEDEAVGWWVRRIIQLKREHKAVIEAWHKICREG